MACVFWPGVGLLAGNYFMFASRCKEAEGGPKPPLNGLGLAVREILGEVGFRELMQRGAQSGVFHLETR